MGNFQAITLCMLMHMHLKHLHQWMQTFHLFCTKKIYFFFLFYTPIFTKHLHQFIYSTYLFNKIFILLQFFIILSLTASFSLSQTQFETHLPLTASLSHRPNPPLSHFLINQTIITILHFIIK